MPSNFSTFRITLLLYVGVLLIPLGFFYTYSSVKESSSDISTVRKLGQISTELLIFASSTDKREKSIQKIHKNLEEIEVWVNANQHSEFYVGGKTLQADFNTIKQCWQQLNKNPKKENMFHCLKSINSLSFTIDKMHTLKQNKIRNMFYINIAGTLILLLLLIYFVRSYIQYQLKKHAIHDYDTNLFNQKYFLARLYTAIERAKREKSPLSIFFLSVDNFTDQTYDAKQKKHLIQQTGHILSLVTRESDTVCRYDDNHFAVLMSLTDKNSALNLEKRMKSALEEYNFQVIPEPQFTFKITEFNPSETQEEFIARSKN